MPKWDQLNVRINPKLHKQLIVYCAEKGISKQEVIRRLVVELLKKETFVNGDDEENRMA